jgi:GrpB-like predicted nucleotidyltransferase (UPF0157 family)
VKVYRFDAEVSRPVAQVAQPGARYAIGPLASADAPVLITAVHLPATGRIERQAGRQPLLLAVVSGDGSVLGGDDRRRAIGPGYAVAWDAGEHHEVSTDAGLTAISIEGDVDVQALLVTREIVVVDHDPEWTNWFEVLRRRIWPAVADVAVTIDHVGSTAVRGLAAKPIVDVDVVVASDDLVASAIERLAGIGYWWRGDLGISGRESFDLEPEVGRALPPHHLYVVVENNRAHLDHWLLRDLLREDGEARERYGALKRRNAAAAGDDTEAYLAAKAALVAELLTRARAERGLPPVTYWQPGARAAAP